MSRKFLANFSTYKKFNKKFFDYFGIFCQANFRNKIINCEIFKFHKIKEKLKCGG